MKTLVGMLIFFSLIAILTNAQAHPFQEGQVRIAASGGGGVGGWSAGLSGGYYVVEGLELGLGATYISADDVALLQTTGSTTYVFFPEQSLNPYTGAFLRRWIVLEGEVEPRTSAGFRGGVYHSSGGGLMLGLGLVYETILDCDDGETCASTYPEFSLSLLF